MMVRYVAEILHLRGCFSLRPRRPPVLEVYTEADAAKAVQDGVPAAVWLDMQAEAVMLTERWADDVFTKQLPLHLDVVRLPRPTQTSPEECVIATVAFTDRQSMELFVKLGLHALPDWLSIRQAALGVNLLVDSGIWLLQYQGMALKVKSIDGSLAGVLQLNVNKASIDLHVLQRKQLVRTEAVSSLHATAKHLQRHYSSSSLSKSIVHIVQRLQPRMPLLQQLKGQIKASAKRGASGMRCWTEVGIMAVLVDCAASIPCPNTSQQPQQLQPEHGQPACSNDAPQLIGLVGDCICAVLLHVGDQSHEQAQLLVSCLARSLGGTMVQKLMAAMLLTSVLKQLTDGDIGAWEMLRKELESPVLLHQLLHCCSSTQAAIQDAAWSNKVSEDGPQSHPLADPSRFEGSDTTPSQLAAGNALFSPSASEAGGQPHRPLVPRLSLPSMAPVTPPVVARSNRLLRRGSEASSSLGQSSNADAPNIMSCSAMLQQLGHSCGESVMAADLAAFVTHKQLHAAHTVTTKGRWGSLPAEAPDDTKKADAPLAFQDLCRLPLAMHLQLAVLECIHAVVARLPADYPLPPGLGSIMSQLLLSQSLLTHQHMAQWQGQPTVQLLDEVGRWQRHIMLQLLARCAGGSPCWHHSSCSTVLGPLQSCILAQFKQHLLQLATVKRPGSHVHTACADALLLLRNYLQTTHQPGLVEATCVLLGHAFGQLEHMLRASRMSLWSWQAVQQMDALVQVYLELAQQAESASAANHLLSILGTQQPSTPRSSCYRGASSSGGGSAAVMSSGGGNSAPAPADTLQLVLDFLQLQHIMNHHGIDGCRSADGSSASAAGAAVGNGTASGRNSVPGCVLQHAGGNTSSRGGTAAELFAPDASAVTVFKAHCWQLLAAVLQLAWKCQPSKLSAVSSTPSSLSWCEVSLSGRTSSIGTDRFSRRKPGLVPADAAGRRSCSSAGNSHHGGADMFDLNEHQAAASQEATAHQQAFAGPGLNLVNNSNGGQQSRVTYVTPSGLGIALGSVTGQQSAASTPTSLQTVNSAFNSSSGGSSCEVLKLLVDLLMRQHGGRPYVVRQLDELDGSQAALPLQLEILNFIMAAYSVPDSYPLTIPQLAEFYVHYHFLHFTRHYYKLPASPSLAALACCKAHVKVLLALCRHTGGANLVRRRFLQLKVLDFLMRELSLEHNLLGTQLAFSIGSCSSTPRSSTGMPSSRFLGASAGGAYQTPGQSRTAAATTAAADGLVGMADPLTERGISGLLASSLVNENATREQHMQPSVQHSKHAASKDLIPSSSRNNSCMEQARDDNDLRQQPGQRDSNTQQHGSASGDNGHSSAVQQQQHASATAATEQHGTVLAAVRQFEAAAVAAASSPVAQLRGSRRAVTHAGDAGNSVAVRMHTEQQFKPRPPDAPCRAAAETPLQQESASEAEPADQHDAGSNTVCWPQLTDTASAAHTADEPAAGDHEDDAPIHPEMATGAVEECSSPQSSRSSSMQSSPTRSPHQGRQRQHDHLHLLHEQQPQLTGDASFDAQLIEEWEEQTGLDYVYDTLSDRGSEDHEQMQQQSESPLSPDLQSRQDGVQRVVPRLALGIPSAYPAATPTEGPGPGGDCNASVSDGSPGSYRPGFDLEEDFERMMNAEAGNREGTWAFSDEDDADGGSSDCSSLIAAGRDSSEQYQHSESSSHVGSPLHTGQGSTCLQLTAVHSPNGLASEGVIAIDSPSPRGHDASSSRLMRPKVPLLGRVAAVADQPAAAAVHNAAANHHDNISKEFFDETGLDDAVGLQEGDEQQEAAAAAAAAESDSSGMLSPLRFSNRRAVVPQLKLPTDQSAAQQASARSSTVCSTTRSLYMGLSPATKHVVPSILAAATPLLTTRMSARTAGRYNSSTAVAPGTEQQLAVCFEQAVAPGTPSAAAEAATGSCQVYRAHRQMHAVYADHELHVLCLELALHLLGTPSGSLDALQLPQEPTDTCLQQKVLILLDHFSHTDNADVLAVLVDRVNAQTQQQHQGRPSLTSSVGMSLDGSIADTARDSSASSTAAVTYGLAGCALRLLKLLCPSLLDVSRLQFGATMQQGAFAEVKSATLLHAGKQVTVAAKVLDSASNDSSCFERVYNEVTILDHLHGYKGVVPLLEYGVMYNNSGSADARQPKWVLAFPRYSSSLRKWRQLRGQGLNTEDIRLYLRIFVQVACIVRDLHAANVVHYDIKGDNLLLDTEHQSSPHLPFDVILADFGDALMFGNSDAAFAQRHRGTELFSSPEMLLLHAGQQNPLHEQHDRRRHRGVGYAHDVWSLGCTLYELMTGHVLFEQEGVGRITSYGANSCGGAQTGATKRGTSTAGSAGGAGGVLGLFEREALGNHAGLIELVEFMLVGDANWRPGAAEVVYKAERLLASC